MIYDITGFFFCTPASQYLLRICVKSITFAAKKQNTNTMDGMSLLITIWLVVILGLCIIVIVLSIQNADLKQQLSDMRIRELMYNRDSQFMQSVLADQVTHQTKTVRRQWNI